MTRTPSHPATTLTGAISATAVIAASGLLATPADAAERRIEASPVTATLAVSPQSLTRALAPAAAPVVLAMAPAATSPTLVPTATKHASHTVVRGDTVWDLARHYGSTVTAIIDANGLDSRATIHVGDTLTIPGATARTTGPAKAASSKSARHSAKHTVKNGDTVWDLAQRYGSSVAAIVSANSLGSSAVIHVGDKLTIPGAKATSSTKASTASGTKKST
ncbi:MAG: LysM peptidoglycan-binding domain-containing protein, partial [Actinomycetota bacterium]